jgi:sugar lactone lactonase YvrE
MNQSIFSIVAGMFPAISTRLPRRVTGGEALCLAGLAALAMLLPGLRLGAQTAHFSGAVTTLGSGFYEPFGVAVDGSGNVYVADAERGAVFEILAVNGSISATNPTINVLASGFSGPEGVAVDASGDVFVTDTGQSQVKEILAVNGSIPSFNPTINVLGSGFNGPAGIALDASGDVFITDRYANAVYEMVAVNGSIPATNPTINTLGSGWNGPMAVALDAGGNVYVSETGNQAVKEILAVDGSIPATNPTINNLGSGLFHSPEGIAVDASGDVYVADGEYWTITEMLAVNGSIHSPPAVITNVGGAQGGPSGLALDGKGNLYACESGNVNEIAFSPNFGMVNVGSASASPLSLIFTFDVGGPFTSTSVLTQGAAGLDFTNAGGGTCTANAVYEVGQSCTVNVTFTPGYPGARIGAFELLGTGGTQIGAAPVQGTGVGPLANFLPGTQRSLGSGWTLPGGVSPGGLAVDGSGNVYVADGVVKEMLAVNGSIPASPTIKTLGSGISAIAVAVDGSGNVFVANSGVQEILAVNGSIPDSPTVRTLGSGFSSPGGIAVDASGNVYIADSNNNAVKEILAVNGSIPDSPTIRTLFSGGNNDVYPNGVAVDGNGNVFFVGVDESSLQEIVAVNGSIPATPTIETLGGSFQQPAFVALDAVGNAFVTEFNGFSLTELLASEGYLGGYAVGGTIIETGAMAISANGNVFVDGVNADYSASVVLEVDVADPPSLNYPTATKAGTTDLPDGPQSVQLENAGNTTLTAVKPGLTVPADFSQVAGSGNPPDCTSTLSLSAGGECNLSIEFTPVSVANPISEALVLTDNSLNATAAKQSIQLTGVGTSSAITLLPTSLPAGTVQVPYSQNIAATGGTPPYGSFGVHGGSLPPGLTLSPAGLLSGTPTAQGMYSFVVTATDSSPSPLTGSLNYQLNIAGESQTIHLTQPASVVSYGAAPITLSATGGGSGNPVTFSVLSGPGTITGSNGNILTFTGVGTVVVAANQAGNANYAAAPQVTVTVVVKKAAQSIHFTGLPSTVKYGVLPIVPVATGGGSGNPVTFSVVSGPGRIVINPLVPLSDRSAVIKIYAVEITGVGTVKLAANQAGNADYQAAPAVTENIKVDPATLTVTANNVSVKYGEAYPIFTYSVTGFVNLDTQSVLSGKPDETTTAVRDSNEGSYPIKITEGTLKAANYNFTFVAGTLTITNIGPTAKPYFSPGSTTLVPPLFNVVSILDATPGAVIYYAIGKDAVPTTASTKYTGPIFVNQTEVINAIAVAPRYDDSAVASATYTVK